MKGALDRIDPRPEKTGGSFIKSFLDLIAFFCPATLAAHS